MKKEKLLEVLKISSINSQIGYFFHAKKHGMGLVNFAQEVASKIWNQRCIVIDCTQTDKETLELEMFKYNNQKHEEFVYVFDNIENAPEELRFYIFTKFSINRDEFINEKSHVVYTVVNESDKMYGRMNDYVVSHAVKYEVE